MAIEYFCCYHSYIEAMEPLNDAEKGRLFMACLTYSKLGEVPQLSGNERFVFPAIKAQIDRDNAKYEARCRQQSENARKRWDATVSDGMPSDANDANEKEKEKAKTKTKTNAKTNAKESIPPLPWAGEALRSAFDDWLAYKQERREGYKETGLRNLESEVRNNASRYGEQAVAELIRTCMANGYRGIIFEKLEERQGKQPKAGSAPAPVPNTTNPFVQYTGGGRT